MGKGRREFTGEILKAKILSTKSVMVSNARVNLTKGCIIIIKLIVYIIVYISSYMKTTHKGTVLVKWIRERQGKALSPKDLCCGITLFADGISLKYFQLQL